MPVARLSSEERVDVRTEGRRVAASRIVLVFKITFITGSPCSGKSTIAFRVAKLFPRCAVVGVDQLRETMVSGRAYPGSEWTKEALQEFLCARSTAAHMAQQYAVHDIVAIIDDVCVPADFISHYPPYFAGPNVCRILLRPNLATLVERMKVRRNPWDSVLLPLLPKIDAQIGSLPEDCWHHIDSSDLTIEQTVHAAFDLVTADSAPSFHSNSIEEPPLPTPASGTPAAGAPVAPPSGSAGL